MTYSADTAKIDSAATLGLLGFNNSLAYRVHEIEKHFHGIERWYGDDGDGTGSTANNLDVWQLAAGTSEGYGTEAQILGANDIAVGDFGFIPVKFDIHRIMIAEVGTNDTNYVIQFWGGTSTFGAAALLTEVPFRAAAGNSETGPMDMMMPRQAVANKIWARVRCQTDSADIDFTVGIHAYIG